MDASKAMANGYKHTRVAKYKGGAYSWQYTFEYTGQLSPTFNLDQVSKSLTGL